MLGNNTVPDVSYASKLQKAVVKNLLIHHTLEFKEQTPEGDIIIETTPESILYRKLRVSEKGSITNVTNHGL